MKKRKKRIVILLCLPLVLCLSACQKSGKTAHTPDSAALVIYILEDNYQMWELEALTEKYNTENPDKQVEIQIGINDAAKDNREQVIQRLNNEIIAGNGPDLLILEGLPQEKYAAQGMLADLEPYIEKIENNNHLFTSIANSYTANGTKYGLPYCFTLLNMTAGKNCPIPEMHTLTDFTAYLEAINHNAKKAPFEKWSYDQLISIMYRLYAAKTDGFLESLSPEQLEEYYRAVADAYNMNDMSAVEKAGKTMETVSLLPLGYESFSAVATGNVQFALDYIETPDNLKSLLCLRQNGYETQLLRSSREPLCVPELTFGVVNHPDSIKTALIEDFLSFAFSESVQENMDTLPVNKDAMEKKLQGFEQEKITLANDEYGAEISLEFTPLSDEEIKDWLALFEQTACVGMTDQKIFGIIMQQAALVIRRKLTATDAAAEAYRQISIYQNE